MRLLDSSNALPHFPHTPVRNFDVGVLARLVHVHAERWRLANVLQLSKEDKQWGVMLMEGGCNHIMTGMVLQVS